MISAIMPTFNRAHMLEQRFYELVNQTVDNWELIIVDDCSTDHTEKVVQSFADSRVKYIRLDKNSGCVTIPRNIGISAADGEFICHVDDDVENTPNKFEDLRGPLLKYNKAVLSYGDRLLKTSPTAIPIHEEILNWNPFVGTGVDNGQIMYRNIYNKIPYVYCTRACDWELAKVLRQQGSFVRVPKVVSIYTWHTTNRSLDPTTKTRPMDIEYFNKYMPSDSKQLIV